MLNLKSKIMQKLTFLTLFVAISFALWGQNSIIPSIEIDENYQPLEINELKIDIKITGTLAKTTYHVKFYNPNNEVLRGNFKFPLGENGVISAFSMDVNGYMRKGVVVEKKLGRKAFEQTVRQRIDPGLLEQTEGNNFQTEVYPIPAKGYKTFKLSFEYELANIDENLIYKLPLQGNIPVKNFEVNAEVFKQKYKPELKGKRFDKLIFKEWNENYKASFSAKNIKLNNEVSFDIPRKKKERTIYNSSWNNTSYFCINESIENSWKERSKPESTLVLWDVSSSGAERNIEKELQLLEDYIQWSKAREVRVICFANKVYTTKDFSGKNSQAITAFLKNQTYDGATNFDFIQKLNSNADEILLFSDGLMNMNEELDLQPVKPLYTINSAPKANHSILKSIALKSGGKYINLFRNNISKSGKLLNGNFMMLQKVSFDKNRIAEVYPNHPFEIHNGLNISGKLLKKEAELTLHFGYNSKNTTKKTIRLNSVQNSANVHKIWAAKKLNNLLLEKEKNQTEITLLGIEYQLATPYTSFIVLDRVEDYVRYEIEPPADILETYESLLNEKRRNEKASQASEEEIRKSRIEKLINAYNVRIAWWKKDFPDKKSNYKIKQEVQNDIRANIREEAVRPTSPPVTQQELNEVADDIELSDVIFEDVEIDKSMQIEIIEFEETEEVAEEAVLFCMGEVSEERVKKLRTQNNNISINKGLKLKNWDPETPYLKTVKEAEDKDQYTVYLNLKKDYKNAPSFFMDMAYYFLQQDKKEEADRILSNILEMDLGNHELLMLAAFFYESADRFDMAELLYKKVLELRDFEPITYRNLALAMYRNNKPEEAIEQYMQIFNKQEVFIELFDGSHELYLAELLNMAAKAYKMKLLPEEFQKLESLPLDFRTTITWNRPGTDIDLWVTDPMQENCGYKHKLNTSGLRLTYDNTRGYGPEEIIEKEALKGEYNIKVNYFSNSSQTITGPAYIKLEIFKDFGKVSQERIIKVIRLEGRKEQYSIGTLSF